MTSARIIRFTAFVALAMSIGCGKTVSRTSETLPASGQGNNSAPDPKDDDASKAKQNQTNGEASGTPAASTSPAPDPLASSSPDPAASPSASVAPGSSPTRQFVTEGGAVSGFLQDGRIYFAPNISYFYTASFTSSASATTVTGEIYFKDAALNPPGTMNSYIHAGPCSNTASKRYQHTAGNATPVVSEIHVPLIGTGTAKQGTGTGNFAFRNEPVSWVIEFDKAPNGRFCADLQVTAK